MSERRIMKCDRCKKEAEADDDIKALGLLKIAIGTSVIYNAYVGKQISSAIGTWEGDWCAACRKEMGVEHLLGIKETDGNKKPENVPTLEDMIREIVGEEVGARL